MLFPLQIVFDTGLKNFPFHWKGIKPSPARIPMGLEPGVSLMSRVKESKVFARDATGLVRAIGPVTAFAIAAAIQTFGLATNYWPSASAWLYPGSDLSLAMLIACVLSVFFAVVYVLFAISMPRSGGDYVYVSRILGARTGFAMSFSFTIWIIILLGIQLPINATYTSAIFAILGHAFGYTPLVNWAQLILQPNWTFAFCLVEGFIAFIIVFFGAVHSSRILNILFYIGMIGQVLVMGLLLFGSHDAFVAGFNSISSTSYSAIMQSAQSAGYTNVPMNIGSTIAALPLAFFAFLGFNYAVYVAGEVREVKKSMWISVIGVLIVALITVGGSTFLLYRLVGFDWFQALSGLYYNFPQSYPLSAPPYTYFLASMTTSNLVIWVIVGISFLAWTIFILPALALVCSRNIFAWAFDRIVPSSLADVDERFHSPSKAVVLIFALGILTAYLYVYTTVFTSFANVTLATALVAIVPCVAAVVYPMKKDMYNRSPASKFRLGKLPLIALCGVIAFAFQVFLTYEAYVTPAISGPTGYPAIAIIVLSLVLPLVIYESASYYRKSKGQLDLALGFKELPPE